MEKIRIKNGKSDVRKALLSIWFSIEIQIYNSGTYDTTLPPPPPNWLKNICTLSYHYFWILFEILFCLFFFLGYSRRKYSSEVNVKFVITLHYVLKFRNGLEIHLWCYLWDARILWHLKRNLCSNTFWLVHSYIHWVFKLSCNFKLWQHANIIIDNLNYNIIYV